MPPTSASTVLLSITLVAALIHLTHAKLRVPRTVVNEFIVRERAYRLSCLRHNCTVLNECKNERGWSIWGSDTGCCGNYHGCCKLASIVCWVHDIFCRCCDYGVFVCGPFCTKDPGCPEEVGSGEIHIMNGTEFSEDEQTYKDLVNN